MLRIAPDQTQAQPDMNSQAEDPANADPQAAGADSPTEFDQDELNLPKLSPQVASYMGPEMGPFACAHCVYFQAPNACHIVSGDIAPDGCCNLFTGQAAGPQAEAPEAAPVENENPDEG